MNKWEISCMWRGGPIRRFQESVRYFIIKLVTKETTNYQQKNGKERKRQIVGCF